MSKLCCEHQRGRAIVVDTDSVVTELSFQSSLVVVVVVVVAVVVKLKFALEEAMMMTRMGSRGIALLFLDPRH